MRMIRTLISRFTMLPVSQLPNEQGTYIFVDKYGEYWLAKPYKLPAIHKREHLTKDWE